VSADVQGAARTRTDVHVGSSRRFVPASCVILEADTAAFRHAPAANAGDAPSWSFAQRPPILRRSVIRCSRSHRLESAPGGCRPYALKTFLFRLSTD